MINLTFNVAQFSIKYVYYSILGIGYMLMKLVNREIGKFLIDVLILYSWFLLSGFVYRRLPMTWYRFLIEAIHLIFCMRYLYLLGVKRGEVNE